MYSEAEAARLLLVSQSTLHYWLEGGTRRGREYLPIVRVEPKGGRAPVTWAEFIECGWLRQYRRTDRVPMRELREFIGLLRDELRIPYPLAHARAFANQGQLATAYELQQQAGLNPEFAPVAQVSGQYILAGPSERFRDRVEWVDEVAAGWRPHDVQGSTVVMRPDVRFGRPSVAGVSTYALWEQVDAGASHREVADDFDLTEKDVRWAVSYEEAQHAA